MRNRETRDRFGNTFMREYRLYGFTGDVASKICCLDLHGHSGHEQFATFYTICTVMKTRIAARSTTRRNTGMLNIDFKL